MISSTGNGKIKQIVRLKKNAKERTKSGLFLVEGPKMLREIPDGMCREVYASQSFSGTAEGQAVLEKLRSAHAEVETVSDPVFEYLSDTRSPQGVLALVQQCSYRMESLIPGGKSKKQPLIIILENLQDPGNLGTIVRTAEAAGATGILMGPGCADIYNPKVTRSTMGSIFRVPFVYTQDLSGALAYLKNEGITICAAHLKGSVEMFTEDYTVPAAFLIGNESRGLTDETARMADKAVRIPMSGSVESLNAAVAAAVLMFEAKRQRIISGRI